jgi:2-amino-4-hydroxy-6-hydroxymethyldihydropteridine diphosphokinase
VSKLGGKRRFPPLSFMALSLIGLGSNRGQRSVVLDRAIEMLGQTPGVRVVARSQWRETAPVGGPSGQAAYLNGAVLVETELAPQALLGVLAKIERQLGRVRNVPWGPRTVDLDLLLYNQRVIDLPELVVPHPRMAWRRFVLEPAAEVAAGMIHPTTGWTIARLLDHLNRAPAYLAIAGPPGAGKTELAEEAARQTGARWIADPPDPRALSASYANPAGNALEAEVQFVFRRAAILGADRPEWQAPSDLAVSDFWLEQSLAYARVWMAAEQRAKFDQLWTESVGGTVRPRLVVILVPPFDRLCQGVRFRARPEEGCFVPETFNRITQELVAQTRKPDCGPVLYLFEESPSRAREEVLAAMLAMR